MNYATGIWKRQRNPRRLLSFVIFGCLFLVGCNFPFSALPGDRAVQEDDIRESIFRYRIAQLKGDGPFFLRVDDGDPSDSFLKRFDDPRWAVKKGSESYFKKEPFPGAYRDRNTDRKATILSVGPINWISSDRVKVLGGRVDGDYNIDAGEYRLRKQDGRWVVVKYELSMIS